jgi:hypothetical protein
LRSISDFRHCIMLAATITLLILSAFIVVLSGAILWFTDTNSGKGKGLVLSGILLGIVVEYLVLFPPSFVII